MEAEVMSVPSPGAVVLSFTRRREPERPRPAIAAGSFEQFCARYQSRPVEEWRQDAFSRVAILPPSDQARMLFNLEIAMARAEGDPWGEHYQALEQEMAAARRRRDGGLAFMMHAYWLFVGGDLAPWVKRDLNEMAAGDAIPDTIPAALPAPAGRKRRSDYGIRRDRR
jgi:hypothetical protein